MALFGKAREKEREKVSAILVAAGSSSRMGENKLLLPLLEQPVLVHTILAFEAAMLVDEIIVVTQEEMIPQINQWQYDYGFRKLTKILRGGETRQQSVQKGLEAVMEEAAILAIHDGARPLVLPGTIDQVIEDCILHGAATAAVPVKDTIKEADEMGFIASTPERSRLYQCQTPQVFYKSAYREAALLAAAEGKDFTDDCQLYENVGRQVFLSEGAYENIKLTTPEDLIFARAILENREEVF